MTLTEERIGINQSRFRAANDRIESTARHTELAGRIPFICECPDMSCSELVQLSDDEYEDVRTDPRHFFTVPSHSGKSGDSAVTLFNRGTYSVLRKVGRAGDVAAELERNPEAATELDG